VALESASHYVLVAGEPSGDALGADLMLAIRAEQPNAQFSGVGGQLMQAAGLTVWFDIEALSVNGFVAPLLKLPMLINLIWRLRRRCLALQPAAFIGIDQPLIGGFAQARSDPHSTLCLTICLGMAQRPDSFD
jgi:lipid-A-disaccharide synthase